MATQQQDEQQAATHDSSAFTPLDLVKNENSSMETLDEDEGGPSLDLLEATEPPLLEDDDACLDFKRDDSGFSMTHECTDSAQADEDKEACLEEKREVLGSPGQTHERQQDSASGKYSDPQQQRPDSLHGDQHKEQELRAPSPLASTTDARPEEQLSVLDHNSAADVSPAESTKLPALSGTKRPPPTPVTSQSFSWNDILRVQNLIERCLQQYLSKHEILMALKEQANVEPDFTTVVWQKLEQQNPSFFRAYNLQLQLKEQILVFNFLVKQQREMMGTPTPANKFLVSTSRAPSSASPWNMGGGPSGARSFFQAPTSNRNKMPRTGARQQQRPTSDAAGAFHSFGSPSPLPLPSPIKSDLDTHAFFT